MVSFEIHFLQKMDLTLKTGPLRKMGQSSLLVVRLSTPKSLRVPFLCFLNLNFRYSSFKEKNFVRGWNFPCGMHAIPEHSPGDEIQKWRIDSIWHSDIKGDLSFVHHYPSFLILC